MKRFAGLDEMVVKASHKHFGLHKSAIGKPPSPKKQKLTADHSVTIFGGDGMVESHSNVANFDLNLADFKLLPADCIIQASDVNLRSRATADGGSLTFCVNYKWE